MRIQQTKNFIKKYDKLPKKLKLATIERLKIFIDNPFNPILRNHHLSGKYEGRRSISVTGDYRIIYTTENDDSVLLFDIGTHSELYGK